AHVEPRWVRVDEATARIAATRHQLAVADALADVVERPAGHADADDAERQQRRTLQVHLLLARALVPDLLESFRALRRRQLALPQVRGLDDVSVGINGLHWRP